MRTFLYIFIIISFMASCSLKKTGQVSNKLDENSIEFVFLLGKNLPCDSILWGASIDFVNDSLLIIEELSGTSTYGVYRVYSCTLQIYTPHFYVI